MAFNSYNTETVHSWESNPTWDNWTIAYDESALSEPDVHAGIKGVEISCTGGNVRVFIYGLHDRGLRGAEAINDRIEIEGGEVIVADATPVQRFALNGPSGCISKILVIAETDAALKADATVTINPIA